jgi:chromosome segregation ATPase
VTSQLLVDFWDQQLPAGGVAAHQVDEATLAHLRDRFHVFYAESKRLTEELNTARATVLDRDKELQVTRRDLVKRTDDLAATRQRLVECTDDLVATRQSLVERTDDLVATRHLLIERTERLEQMVAQVKVLSKELAEAKARSATAEPTSDSPETTPPTPGSRRPAA